METKEIYIIVNESKSVNDYTLYLTKTAMPSDYSGKLHNYHTHDLMADSVYKTSDKIKAYELCNEQNKWELFSYGNKASTWKVVTLKSAVDRCIEKLNQFYKENVK